jgi:hypothetical protein
MRTSIFGEKKTTQSLSGPCILSSCIASCRSSNSFVISLTVLSFRPTNPFPRFFASNPAPIAIPPTPEAATSAVRCFAISRNPCWLMILIPLFLAVTILRFSTDKTSRSADGFWSRS